MNRKLSIPGNATKKAALQKKEPLARISHKDRCERPESAGNAGLQRQKARRHIEIFRGCFLGL
jgi:hypothetical protein